MSYGITPVAVLLSRVEQSFGGGDESLVRQILDEFAGRFEQDRTDPDDEDEPALEQALPTCDPGRAPRCRSQTACEGSDALRREAITFRRILATPRRTCPVGRPSLGLVSSSS